HDAALLGEAAQELGIEARVEMVGVRQRRLDAAGLALNVREAVAGNRNRMEDIMAERLGDAELATAQPVMVEGDNAEGAADQAEGVDIGFVGLAPAVERDAELIGAAGRGEEFGL